MLAIKSTPNVIVPLRQVTNSRRLISGDSRNGGKVGSTSKVADKSPHQDSSSSSDKPFSSKEDLHGYGLDAQTVSNIKASLFPKEEAQPQKPLDWAKDEQKQFNHPIRSGIDKFADRVEHGRTAQSSENFTASKGTTDAAAHFASSDRAAHAADGVRKGVEGAASTMSDVGKRIAKVTGTAKMTGESIASSVQDVDGYKQDSSSSPKDQEFYNTSSSSSSSSSMVDGAKEKAKEGMEKFSEKMSDMGQSLAGSMKGVEGMADSLSHMSMPKSISDAKDTIVHATESIKEAMPKSMDDLKHSVENLTHSIPKSAASATDSIKGAMPSMPKSMPKSMDDLKQAMPDVKQAMPKSVLNATESIKDAMPKSMEDLKSTVSDKVSNAKDTVNAAAEQSAGVFDSFRQGMSTMKEAMKPIVDFSSEKLREGAHLAAEKIPPMASSLKDNLKAGVSMAAEKIPPIANNLKDKANNMMHSQTAESIKDSLPSMGDLKEKAKDTLSSVIPGLKSEADKMNIKQETVNVSGSKFGSSASKDQVQPKDQAMGSSDISKQ